MKPRRDVREPEGSRVPRGRRGSRERPTLHKRDTRVWRTGRSLTREHPSVIGGLIPKQGMTLSQKTHLPRPKGRRPLVSPHGCHGTNTLLLSLVGAAPGGTVWDRTSRGDSVSTPSLSDSESKRRHFTRVLSRRKYPTGANLLVPFALGRRDGYG